MDIDCLFIHPTTHLKKPPQPTGVDRLAYLVLPVGTAALANLLDTEGYGAKIIHTGVEESYDRNFSIERLLKKYDPSVVGIDLHWYVHAYDGIRIAQIVKQSSNAFVVFGGFTASFFAEEILTRFDSVDAVIRGDAEIPLLELVKHRLKQASSGDFEKIPNLMYRQGTALKQSSRRYIADESNLNQLNFSSFDLLNNFDKYLQLSLSVELGHSNLNRLAYPCLGRGCSMNCVYCGGGKDAHQLLTGLNNPIFLSKEKVIEQLVRFVEMKISSIYVGFDPDPEKRDYHQELFAMIRKEKIDIGCQFESWDISGKDFLKDFRRTFNPLYSSIIHSIQSGSEEVRNLNTGYHYSNEELFRWLSHAKEELIPVELAFASGLSGETEKHFDDTINMAKKIVEEYPMVLDLYCIPASLEPCSLQFLNPQKYGLTLKFTSFLDYYDFFKRISEGAPTSSILGYETNLLSEQQILELSQRFYNALQHQLTGRSQTQRT
ncbi:MAG: radical SAM protein [Candidatus Bathyarchaeota archaeon]|nr:radical SAM protein [Candidatus Bathyarchaeota archaeon]